MNLRTSFELKYSFFFPSFVFLSFCYSSLLDSLNLSLSYTIRKTINKYNMIKINLEVSLSLLI